MSGQMGDQQERTEAPTARRLSRAQEEGEVPVSREAVLLAGLAAAGLTFLLMDQRIGLGLARSLAVILGHPDLPLSEPVALYHELALTMIAAVAPFAAPIALGAIAATLAQTRFALRPSGLHVDFSRISPRRGLTRMIGSESLMEFVKSLVKLIVVGGGMAIILRDELPRIEVVPFASLALLPGLLVSVVTRLLL